MALQFQRPQLANSIIDPSKIDLTNTQTYNFGGGNTTLQYKLPTALNEVATKEYVDSLANGLYWKDPCRLASSGALPASAYSNGASGVGATITANANGVLSVDGTVVVSNDRLLIKDEPVAGGIALRNGIYKVTTVGSAGAPFVLTRTADMDTSAEFSASAVFIQQGTHQSEGFVNTNSTPPTVGTTTISYVQFTGVGQLIGGAGIDKSADVISVDITANSGLGFNVAGASGKLEVKLDPNNGLAFASASPNIKIDYDNATIGIISNKLAVKDNSLGLAKMSFRPKYEEFVSQSGTTISLSTAVQAGFEQGVVVYMNGQALRFKAVPSDNQEYKVLGTTVSFGANLVATDVIGIYYTA